MRRVLVCGGRDYADAERMNRILDLAHAKEPFSVVIHGMMRGADKLADAWARSRSVPVEDYAADWATHGKAAGPIRNARMLAEGKPDVVAAFAGGDGTEDMKNQARRAGIKVVEIG